MAVSSGNLKLDNRSLDSMAEAISSYEETAQDVFYTFYKAAYILSASSHYRGQSADAFKAYMTNGPVNVVTELLDITSDLSMIAKTVKETFLQVEPNSNGRIGQAELVNVQQGSDKHAASLEDYKGEINATLNQAAEYISPVGLNYSDITAAYQQVDATIDTIDTNLATADQSAKAFADELYERISKLKLMISNLRSSCYAGGSFNEEGASGLASREWYVTAANTTLALKLEEDPFSYEAGEVTLTEDQWVAGLCQDVYAYAGYSLLARGWEYGAQDGTVYANGYFSAIQGDARAQFTEFAVAEGQARVGYVEGDVKAGWSDEYVGAHAEGSIGVAQAEGKIRIGPEEFGGFISGAADFCTAEGAAAFELEDDGEFAIGLKGEATAAQAKATAGFDFLSYSSDNDGSTFGEKEKKRLFGASASAKAGAGVSAGAWLESETAIEGNFVNVNATSFSLDLSLIVGFEVDVTVPTLSFKWPW